jgi:hypothetical protein
MGREISSVIVLFFIGEIQRVTWSFFKSGLSFSIHLCSCLKLYCGLVQDGKEVIGAGYPNCLS